MAPMVRDADPAMRRLLDFVDDQDNDRPVHVMALALRAALSECAQEQSVALAGLEEKADPAADRAQRDAEARFRWDSLGRLYMANKVVRRIAELVGRLGERPAVPDPVEDRDEVASLLGEGIHTGFRKAVDGRASILAHQAVDRLTDDEWAAVLDFALDGLAAAGYSIVKDPTVCEDFPAPCNCDDPLIHNGH